MQDHLSIQLLNRYREGDPQAASELFDRYVQRLMGLARSRLSAKLARRIDPEDVIQSAYRSFFGGAAAGNFDIRQSGDLWRLLAAITLNKLRMQARRHTAEKRNLSCEDSISMPDDMQGLAPQALAHDPQPEEVVAVAELLENVMTGLSAQHRRMLELRLQNHNIQEIADDVGCSERTVRRLLDRVKTEFQQNLAAVAEPV